MPPVALQARPATGLIRDVRLAEIFVAPVATAIATWLVSQEFTGEQVSLGDAVRRAMRRFPGVIGVSLLAGLSVAPGLIALIVGGFVVAAWMYTAIPVYTLENVRAIVYYDLRVRREGMDIEVMAAALDDAPPALLPVEVSPPKAPEANPA